MLAVMCQWPCRCLGCNTGPAGVLEATLAVMCQWPCRCLGGNTGSLGPVSLQVSWSQHWQSWASDLAGVYEVTLAVMGQGTCRCLGGNAGSHGPVTLQVSRWQHWQSEASDPVGIYEATLTVMGHPTCGFLQFAGSQWIVILRWSKEGAKDFCISSHSLVFHGLMPIHELDQLKEQQPSATALCLQNAHLCTVEKKNGQWYTSKMNYPVQTELLMCLEQVKRTWSTVNILQLSMPPNLQGDLFGHHH